MFIQKFLFLAVIFLSHNILKQVNSATINNEKSVFVDCESSASVLCARMTNNYEHIEGLPQARLNKFKLISTLNSNPATNQTHHMQSEPSLGDCKTETFLISPITGIERNNQFVILGNYPGAEQLVKVEVCAMSNAECTIPQVLANDEESICLQHYTERHLLVVDHNNINERINLFPLPSGCNCAIVKKSRKNK